jgi:DNA-binding transcriptional LysR family regulator
VHNEHQSSLLRKAYEFMHRDNWDDLRYVLAVAETGSVSAASRMLKVNHATVLRRIAAFEDRQGAEVFERSPQGYQVPSDRLRLVEAAREVRNAIDTVGRILQGAEAQLSGVVRVTSTDTFCISVLPDVVAEITAESPELRIELQCTNAHLDLSRLHADISVRPAVKLPDELTGDQAGILGMRSYGPANATGERRWLGVCGALSRSKAAEFMAKELAPGEIVNGADSFPVLREMVAAGLGKTILPNCLGDPDPRVERLHQGPNEVNVPVWVASHTDLADAPRLRNTRRRIAEALEPRLAGYA